MAALRLTCERVAKPLPFLNTTPRMSWFKQDKERERFYLLPGQGGRALRRKRKLMLQWSLVVGLLVSAVLAWAIYWLNHSPR